MCTNCARRQGGQAAVAGRWNLDMLIPEVGENGLEYLPTNLYTVAGPNSYL